MPNVRVHRLAGVASSTRGGRQAEAEDFLRLFFMEVRVENLVTFSRLRLRPSKRVNVSRQSWWGRSRQADERAFHVLGEAHDGLGVQDLEVDGVRGRIYVALFTESQAAARIQASLQARHPELKALSIPGALVIVEADDVDRFNAAIAVRLGNRLREATLGGPPLEEDDLDPDGSFVLFPSVNALDHAIRDPLPARADANLASGRESKGTDPQGRS